MNPVRINITHVKSTFKVMVLMVSLSCVTYGQSNHADSEHIVHSFLKCWESNDILTFENLLHDSVLFAYPGDRLNKEELVDLFRGYQQEKEEIKIYLWETFLSSGNKFATAYQFAATDILTNKRQAVGTGIIGEIQDGKIILLKEYYDESVATLQYQGKLPLDEGKVTPWPSSIWLRPETID